MSAQARDDAFHASLAGPLGRSAMTLAGTAFFVILVNTLVEALGGFVGGAPTTIRAATLVLLAACAATFWREEAPTRAFAFAAIVLGVLMANICGLALLLSQTRSDAWGAMYLLLVLPAILSWRPRALGCLSAVLLAPAIATSLTAGDSLPEASTRSMILAGTALFGYLIARANYHARRREFDAALELQEANHSLRAAHVHLVQADKLSALGTLSACIAHELAQPLTLMMGYTGVLASKLATGVPNEAELANQVRQVETMRRATSRMVSIVDHLRRFGRRSGRARAIDLNEVVQGALLFMESEYARADVQLTLELCDEGARVWSDGNELEQIALNLLMNARDALKGRASPRVTVRTRLTEEGEAILEVQDNGAGVLPEMTEQLFQPFATSKSEGRGMGLGLWVSRSIARHWSGQLRHDAAPGGGAIFRLTLPQTNADPHPSSPSAPRSDPNLAPHGA